MQRKSQRNSNSTRQANIFSAYRCYRALSHDPAHVSLSALARHFSPHHKLNVVPPFKPGERVAALDWGCEALVGVCMGVDRLMGGTAQSEAIGAFKKRFVDETSEPA
jgi:hypothetical protein